MTQEEKKEVPAEVLENDKKEGMKEEEEDDFEVTPYTTTSKGNKEIDYNKLIQKFGCYHLPQELVDRMEKLTGKKPHYFLRREIFFSHRELDLVLNAYENNK